MTFAIALFSMQVESLLLRAALRNMSNRSRSCQAVDISGRMVPPTSHQAVAWSTQGAIAKEAELHAVPDGVRLAAEQVMRRQVGDTNEATADYHQLVVWWTAAATEARAGG